MKDVKLEQKNNTDGDYIKKEIFSWIRVFVGAALVALFINFVIIVNASIPSGSMNPTIPDPSRLIAFRLSYLFSSPERGDIIVFRAPDNNVLNVKRIIGMPGDNLRIQDNYVYINDVRLDEPYLKEPMNNVDMIFHVPEGHYFVMGDNRNDSQDSRRWINTFLPRENIRGRAIFMYWPRFEMIR